MSGTLPSLFFSGDFQPKREKHSKWVPNWWPMRGPKRVSLTPATEQSGVFFQSSRKPNLCLWTCVLKEDAYYPSREADRRAPPALGYMYGVWLDSSMTPALILPVAAKLLALSSEPIEEILEKSPPETSVSEDAALFLWLDCLSIKAWQDDASTAMIWSQAAWGRRVAWRDCPWLDGENWCIDFFWVYVCLLIFLDFIMFLLGCRMQDGWAQGKFKALVSLNRGVVNRESIFF